MRQFNICNVRWLRNNLVFKEMKILIVSIQGTKKRLTRNISTTLCFKKEERVKRELKKKDIQRVEKVSS